jgi:hypothetical protein
MKSGGIDLSVGAMMARGRDAGASHAAGVPIWASAALHWRSAPPAERSTEGSPRARAAVPRDASRPSRSSAAPPRVDRGYAVYSRFPAGFLATGQGVSSASPPQALLVAGAGARLRPALHRSTFGRREAKAGRAARTRVGGRALGCPRVRAWFPARRSPACAYAAHPGQGGRRGSGWELAAIAGRSSARLDPGRRGDGRGHAARARLHRVLQNGLLVTGSPSELARSRSVLVGTVLLRHGSRALASSPPARHPPRLRMKNSQVVLVLAIPAGR